MKLKYYLRGLAVGILVTTVVLMIAGKGHGTTMTDDEVIARAKQLGMVMEDSKTGDKEDLFSGKDNKKEDTESTQSTEKQEQKTENKNDSNPPDENKQETTGSSENQTGQQQDAATQDQQQNADAGQNPDTQQNADSAQQSAQDSQDASAPEEPQYVEVIVSPGEYCRAVSEDLASKGLVSDSESFRKYMLEIKQDELISSGVYQIPVGASYEDIAQILISGNK